MTLHRAEEVQTVTVANGGTTSEAIATSGAALFGVFLPAALTSTVLRYTVCDTATGTFVALYSSTGVIVADAVAGTSRYLDCPTELAAVPFFKVVLGSAEGAARTLRIVKKG